MYEYAYIYTHTLCGYIVSVHTQYRELNELYDLFVKNAIE